MRGVAYWLLFHYYLLVASTCTAAFAFTATTKGVTRHGFLFPRTIIPVYDNSKDGDSSFLLDSKQMTTKRQRRTPSSHLASSTAAIAWLRPKTALQFFRNHKPLIKKTLLASLAVLLVMGFLEARRARQRQALDATSEWSRYAQNPSARGRAVMTIGLRLLPYWIRYQFASLRKKVERQKEISLQSGILFSDELLQLGPLYIKLGQILSCRDNLLPTAWITAMERLQDRVPAQSGAKALELAHAAAGSPERFDTLFSDFDDVPLAAASLGQVHRATLRETQAPVAIKLQRPNLRQIYDQDLAFLLKIAGMIDKIPSGGGNVGGVSQSWTDIVEDAREILYREIDYRDEADNALRFNTDFGLGINGTRAKTTAISLDGEPLPSASSWLRAPHVYRNISSEQLLVMEYVPSLKITKATDDSRCSMKQREFLAESLARTYLRCFCTNRFFSTDPHPGNLGVEFLERTTNSNPNKVRLVMYDFGQACELQTSQAAGILNVIEAIVDYDSDKCVDAFAQMGVLKDNADLVKVRAKVQDNFETGKITVKRNKLKKRGYVFTEKSNSTSTNNSTAATADGKVKDTEVMGFFTLPTEYAFVARALTQMNGVGKTLDPDFDFISSSAPYIVEIKGATNYLQDEWSKW
eukprot:CAMPEP_0194229950 /NCGR_PEP_ID=MMETSP0156-20130528/44157_1 /TAXON_ID=33649 /ORGANISM="Thalassionema nitzschioides, Strain L26-B" /LENGTH=637 /DNA_ID=CAMNT_0038962515 /DNA_START=102 /DNA_END=2012 /DNA_ORIENTATION=-